MRNGFGNNEHQRNIKNNSDLFSSGMVTVIPASSSAMRKKAFFTGTLITPQPPWTVRDYEDKETRDD
uniref:Uncharacterized protein n=1 Tax=Anguilla anguilla TaxID=7936 RepID=A0A0E9R3L8_ANGAN